MLHGFPDDAAIAAAAAGVLDCTLPKPVWTHAAHFAVTLWLLRHVPGFDGARNMPVIIAATTRPPAVPTPTAKAITTASPSPRWRGAAAALAAAPGMPLHLVLDGIMAGPMGRSDWLLAYWSRDLLFSVEARRGWREPDLAALPF